MVIVGRLKQTLAGRGTSAEPWGDSNFARCARLKKGLRSYGGVFQLFPEISRSFKKLLICKAADCDTWLRGQGRVNDIWRRH